jgi:transmembrane sensor
MTSFPDSRISDELRDQAIEWAIRCLDGGSEEERRALAAWLEEDPAHRAASAEIAARLEWLDSFRGADLPARREAARYRPSRHRRRAQRWVGLALAAALVLALGLTAFSPDGWYGSRDRYVAARGDFQTVDLADGSRLELNTDSEVEVRLNRWQRSVTLVRGEAYFRVAHDAERPFVVIAGNGRSVDIGTEFDVYMRPDRVLVAVHEGRVRVDARQSRWALPKRSHTTGTGSSCRSPPTNRWTPSPPGGAASWSSTIAGSTRFWRRSDAITTSACA